MKRSLVIGCAAVALAAGCGTASAQSKSNFDIVMGGDAFFQAGYVDQDIDTNLRKTEFSNRFRVTITPTAKADNGLEYGGRIRIRTWGPSGVSGNGATTDRAFIFANGPFGTIQAGTNTGLSDDYGVIGPNVDGISGSPDGFWGTYYSNATGAPYVLGQLRALESSNADTKLTYLTPTFSGFQAGVAYAPKPGDANTSVNRVKGSTVSAYRDQVEVQGTYKNTFGSVGLEASAAYIFAKSDFSNLEDLSSFHAGATLAFGGLKVGGSYAFSGDSGYTKGHRNVDDQQVWILGAQYAVGPVILAANYTDAKGSNIGPGAATAVDNARAHLWQAGVTYTIAPGFTTGLEYSYLDNKSGGVNNDANIFLLDTRFAF